MNPITGFLQFLLFLAIIFGGISLMLVIINNVFGWEGTTPCDEPITDFRPFNSSGCRSL